MTLLGAVLAGGASRRMGKDKAVVEVSGVSFLDRVAARPKVQEALAAEGLLKQAA